jgi:uridine kinase
MHIIGITGLSCSGKTTLAKKLVDSLGGNDECLLISIDNYYKELTQQQLEILHNDSAEINFDTPEAIDFNLLKQNLIDIKQNKLVRLPKFDIASCIRTDDFEVTANKYKFIILEGLFVFWNREIANLCDLKLWVETTDYVCALRRFIKFTTVIKGYTSDYVYNQCLKYVIPGQEMFIKPVKKDCDFFINGENNDEKSIEMIVKYVSC